MNVKNSSHIHQDTMDNKQVHVDRKSQTEVLLPFSIVERLQPWLDISAKDRVAFVGSVPGPRCSSWYQRALSVCVSKDERRYKPSSVECDQQGPRCTPRTTWCCVSRQGSHAALAKLSTRELSWLTPVHETAVEQTGDRWKVWIHNSEDMVVDEGLGWNKSRLF